MFDYEYWGNATLPAHLNMALEEFFLRRAATGKAIVRFYSFPRDTVVLGYAQANDPVKRFDNTFDVTRRISGGSHIQTGQNIIAYSFAAPRDGSFSHYEDMRAYYAQHVADALTDLGIEGVEVDNKASTINVDGKIIAAHAAVWGVHSALLHGLICIDPYDADGLANRVQLGTRKIGGNAYSEYQALKRLPAISLLLKKLAPHAPDRTAALREIVGDAILRRVTRDHEKMEVTPQNVKESYELMRDKFGQSRWINSRRPPFTKQEIEEIPFEELNGELLKNLDYCLFLQVENSDFKRMCTD